MTLIIDLNENTPVYIISWTAWGWGAGGGGGAALKTLYRMSVNSSKLYNNLCSKVSDKYLLYCLFFLLQPNTHTHAHACTHAQAARPHHAFNSAHRCFYPPSTSPLSFLAPHCCIFNTQVSLPDTFTAREHKASLDTAIASKLLCLMVGRRT